MIIRRLSRPARSRYGRRGVGRDWHEPVQTTRDEARQAATVRLPGHVNVLEDCSGVGARVHRAAASRAAPDPDPDDDGGRRRIRQAV